MFSILLVVIYLAFISLGLPDSLLGSAWPVVQLELQAPLSFAGVLSMIISGGTIVSSLFSDRLTRKLGAGLVTSVSVAMTAVALFGFSKAPSVGVLCLWCIPYGLGAGAVDAALNNYVALHYSGRHMSWLHCMWGVGTAISPYIMSACMAGPAGWRGGYSTISILQVVLTAILFISLPLWKKDGGTQEGEEAPKSLGLKNALRIPGVPYVLLAFLGYCAMESTCGLWASTYMVNHLHVDTETAARFASLFYLGITFGRFLNGFAADKVGDKALVRLGICIALVGIAMVAIPFGTTTIALVGLVVIGLGCAPIYPCLIHATPVNFGRENSQAIVGIQMACAYVGSTFLPPIFGLLAGSVSIALYPFYMALFALLMLLMSEKLNRVTR